MRGKMPARVLVRAAARKAFPWETRRPIWCATMTAPTAQPSGGDGDPRPLRRGRSHGPGWYEAKKIEDQQTLKEIERREAIAERERAEQSAGTWRADLKQRTRSR